MKKYLFLVMIFVSVATFAQDTLKIMHYNFLNYGNYTSYCTEVNNNFQAKDKYIRTIIGYELPDILTVNEISSLEYYHKRILDSVLNVDGRDYYRKGPVNNSALSEIVNMFYYNSEKFTLKSHLVLQNELRDIDLYRLYCKTPDPSKGDSVYLNCIVAHLKAGSSNSDANQRAEMTANVMEYLEDYKQPGNYLFMGDMNTYSSYEDCYQNLTGISAYDFRFFDPVNAPGDWNNNRDFAFVHTQSVVQNGSGCQASGGMDDRFDHILATAQVMNGSQGLKYIQDSYHAVAQDGLHFNKSINESPNTTVPADVLDAIVKNSDHLPVRLNLLLLPGGPAGLADLNSLINPGVYVMSPENARIFVTSSISTKILVSVFSITGTLLHTEQQTLTDGHNELNLNISGLKSGIYILRLSDLQGRMATLKLAK